MENSASTPVGKCSGTLAIAVGGLSAGTLDLLQASILFGWSVPKVIAAGLLGKQAIHGGTGMYLLGLILHYFIAATAAGIYYGASRKLPFLKVNWIVCGLFFGMAVENIMNLIVLPLSALHSHGPYHLQDLILGIVVHMIVVGLPIAFSIRRFSN